MYIERPSSIAGAMLWRATGGGTSTILPDGCIDVLWWNNRLVIAGPDERAHLSVSDPESVTLGIRFAPGTAPALLGAPAHTFANQRVALSELWNPGTIEHIEHDLLAQSSAAHSPTLALLFERRIAEKLRVPDARRTRHARALASAVARGQSVAEIADRTGYSARQLQRLSNEEFGYGLSVLARILRFQRALPELRSTLPFAVVAAHAGYSDQAHLSREVRALSGLTPSQLRGENL